MNDQYFPIVRAKQGEIEAFENLDALVLKRCTPVFEVTKLDGEALERACKRSDTPYEDYLDSRASNIAKIFKGKHVIIDTSHWPTGFTTEGGEQVLSYLCNRLVDAETFACPVIGYDRWESAEYREMIKAIILSEKAFFCIRLDSIALEDLGDLAHFNTVIEEISALANITAQDTPILIDLGDVTRTSVQELLTLIEGAYTHMLELGFKYIIMAASSIPDSIEKAVKNTDSTGVVQRKEMIAWKSFMSDNPQASLFFGDYGVRNPRSSDTIAPDMNVKIRYTIENAFLIARGHSVRGENGYAQSQVLSRIIVNSLYFMKGFSWGDDKILECSQGEFIGSSTNWISYDTNHHISTIAAEIREFSAQLEAATARAQVL